MSWMNVIIINDPGKMFVVSRSWENENKKSFLNKKTDLERPKIANCPEDIYKTSSKKWTKIFLPGVTVTDNVGVHLFTTSRQNGSEFTWGKHSVTYTVSDKAGNTVHCHFQVINEGMYSFLG